MKFIVTILEWLVSLVFRLMDAVDGAIKLPPLRIELTPVTNLATPLPEVVRQAVSALEAEGFVLAGTYQTAELNNLLLTGLVHPETKVQAAVWVMREKRQEVLHMDLVTRFADGSVLTTTNHESGKELPRPSGHVLRRVPGFTPGDLYRRHLSEHGEETRREISPERFAVTYEELWLSKQEWLSARGGYTKEELRAMLKAEGTVLKEDELTFLRERTASAALRNWYAMQLAPPIPFEVVQDCLVIVHDELGRDTVEYLFDRWSSGLDVPKQKELTPRQVFATLQGNEESCIQRIWTKREPLEADYYCPKALLASFVDEPNDEDGEPELSRQRPAA